MVRRIIIPPTLSLASLEGLGADIAAAAADDRARVWVLEGAAPGEFCRGMDLTAMLQGEDPARGPRAFAACLEALGRAPRPVIAIIDGAVQGGGLGIAAAADLVIATWSSTFALPEALFGLLPAIVAPVLLERLAPRDLRWLALHGGALGAEWAATAGLVDEVVREAAGLEWSVQRHVRELSRVESSAVVGLRRLVSDAARTQREAAIAEGAALTGALILAPRIRDRIRAFTEDGQPPWLVGGDP